jgi:hypothetical protein
MLGSDNPLIWRSARSVDHSISISEMQGGSGHEFLNVRLSYFIYLFIIYPPYSIIDIQVSNKQTNPLFRTLNEETCSTSALLVCYICRLARVARTNLISQAVARRVSNLQQNYMICYTAIFDDITHRWQKWQKSTCMMSLPVFLGHLTRAWHRE